MDQDLPEIAEEPRRRRRKSHKKSSKELHRRRQRMKDMGMWIFFCLLGAAVVTAIAVFVGNPSIG